MKRNHILELFDYPDSINFEDHKRDIVDFYDQFVEINCEEISAHFFLNKHIYIRIIKNLMLLNKIIL